MRFDDPRLSELVSAVLQVQQVRLKLTRRVAFESHTEGRGFAIAPDGERYFVQVHTFPALGSVPARKRYVDAAVVASWTEQYLDELRAIDVPTPVVCEVRPFIDPLVHGLLLVTSDEGQDLRRVLQAAGPRRAERMLVEVAVAFRRVFEHGRLGLDPEPTNFTWRNRRATYVHVFPPLLPFMEGEPQLSSVVLAVPQPSGEGIATLLWRRQYQPASMLRWFTLQLLEIDPHLPKLFRQAVAQVLPAPLYEAVVAEFRSLPARRILATDDTQERLAILRATGVSELDDLRELVVRLVPRQQRRRFERFFDPLRPLTPTERLLRVEELKAHLSAFL